MTELAPPGLVHFEPTIRDHRIAWTAGASVLVHVLVLALLLWPVLQHPAPPPEPKPIAVDVVTPKQYAELVKPPPPKPISKPEEKIAEASKPRLVPPPRPVVVPLPSMEVSSEPVSSAPESSEEASSEAASSMDVSSAVASSIEASSAAASSAPAASSEASSAASEPTSASETASTASAEPSGSASEAAPSQVLTASGAPDASADAVASELPAAPAAPAAAAVQPAADLRPARHLLSGALLKTPEMAQMRAQLKARGTHLSLVQLCNIEAIAQVRQDSPLAAIDMFVANATAPTAPSGQTLSVPGGAFRIGGDWFGIAYDCTAAKNFESVTAFSFKLGGQIAPSALGPRLNGLAGGG